MATKAKITFNPALVSGDMAREAFGETMLLLGVEFTKAISSPIWGWVDGSTRDIVDTGRLRDSQSLPDEEKPGQWMFAWNVEYAAAVHEGATMRNGNKLPARPWTQYAIDNFDISEVFSKLMMSKAGS